MLARSHFFKGSENILAMTEAGRCNIPWETVCDSEKLTPQSALLWVTVFIPWSRHINPNMIIKRF